MNKLSKQIIAVVLLLALVSAFGVAGNKSRIGTAGGQELLVPVGARGIALGGSQVAFASGVDAIYWNPAGLARTENGVEAMFSHMTYFADMNVNYAAIGVRTGNIGTFGISIKTFGVGDMSVTNTTFPDGTGETYSPSMMVLGFSYSNKLIDRVSVGVTANLINESIMSTSASGVGFNFGLQYSGLALPGLNLGMTIKNIGPTMRFEGANLLKQAQVVDSDRPTEYLLARGATFELPTYLEIGLSYHQMLNEENALTFGGNFQNNNFEHDEFHVGGEYVWNNILSVRGGYSLSPDAGKDALNENNYGFGASFGVGVHTVLSGVALSVDYAYREMHYFDGNNVLTISVGF